MRGLRPLLVGRAVGCLGLLGLTLLLPLRLGLLRRPAGRATRRTGSVVGMTSLRVCVTCGLRVLFLLEAERSARCDDARSRWKEVV
jgi:hypothetical protein